MPNIAIFDPWQRSLFSRQQTTGKEPLLGGKGSEALAFSESDLSRDKKNVSDYVEGMNTESEILDNIYNQRREAVLPEDSCFPL